MKSRLMSILLTCACASLARADFNPIALTPDSYTEDIVVEASTIPAVSQSINVTAGSGVSLGDNTYFEQLLYSRPGTPGANIGIPHANTTFVSINNTNMTFLMPPDYLQNNDAMIDATFTSDTLTFTSATTATNLAILCCSGGGGMTVNYTVTHADNSTETGTLALPDWFNNNANVAWGANGRITATGGYNNINTDTNNTHAPYLFGLTVPVSGSSPVASIEFDYTTGGAHANFFGVSGNASGAAWTPIPLDAGSFNVKAIVPAAVPFPVNATMDRGTNIANTGNGMNTWFEQGFDRNLTTAGLPPSGTSFDSVSQPTHHYQLGDYAANNSTLIDTNHQYANITPASPASYAAISLLTAGGNEGAGNIMTNLCVLQHADGVNETNELYGYDWFDQNYPGAIALKANGRVDMQGRSINAEGGQNFPFMFETYFLVNDTTSPITNIAVMFKSSPNVNATTFIMAVSGATGGAAPVVNVGPIPNSQTVNPGDGATFTVGVFGTQPITGYWQVENAGTFYPLSDGLSANGSMIYGSHTMSLSISNAFALDGTNYQFVASNAYGTNTSPNGTLIVRNQSISITPVNPSIYTGNTIPLTVHLSQGPSVGLQWYYIDNLSNSNSIPGATNATYTITNAQLSMSGYTYGVIATNVYGTNIASTVVSIYDSPAFLASDLSPSNSEAYAGAPVTYKVDAQGNTPITYQWMVNGSVVLTTNSGTFTIPAICGANTIQVAFSNELSGGVMVMSSVVALQGDPYPTNLTFNTDGTGWQTNTAGNGNVPTFANNALTLTDGGGGEASSAYFKTAQFVGGTWSASFTYNSHAGGADGMAFVLQNDTRGINALGGGGGALGYNGVTNSLAFEINLYPGNNQTIGIAMVTNGTTGVYQSSDPVSVNTTNPIAVELNWSNGVLAVTLTDTVTMDTFSTNQTYGSLLPILGGNLAYVGFSGADGGVTSTQTISDFQFHSTLPPVSLAVSPVSGNSVMLLWPANDPNYLLQTSSSLSSPNWTDGPTPITANGTNSVTVDVSGGTAQQFYRLERVVCP